MKNSERPGKWKRYILPTLLLAAVCIGGVELWVCSFQAPDVYAVITAPIRTAVRQAGEWGELAWNGLSRRAGAAVEAGVSYVEEGVSQVQAGLSRLNEYLTREPDGPQEEIQLVDDGAVEPPPRSKADYFITALAARNGRQYLTGGSWDVVYFDQTAKRWASEPYGSDTIGSYGCGPAAMAMVVSTLTDTYMDPVQMARYCVDNGYWAAKHGSYWSIVPGTAEDFGLTCVSLPPEETDTETLIHYLATGHLVVAMVGPGHFTNGGHFIVLRGVTLDGSVLVADSASQERSLTTWDPALILEELSASRSNGGPLWAISFDSLS